MQYRNFGSLDWKVSALGFGCMRLPTTDSHPENIDEPEAIHMIRYAIDNGVNYVDTAYMYHNGRSEVVLGKALKDGYREKVKIASKSPVSYIRTPEDYDRILDEQLKRLDVDHIDFYLFHGIGHSSWETVKNLDLLSRAEAALKAGKIAHIGFSFHDDYKAFEEIINGYDGWTSCQIQYNYMDADKQAGRRGLQLAASRGLAVSIMEPLQGGKLARPPKEIQEEFNNTSYPGDPADFSLQWIWDQPEVSVVLSGMSTFQQVTENLQSASNSGVGQFRDEDRELILKIQQLYKNRVAIPCTSCRYCMPCPNSVNIPRNLQVYNEAAIYGDVKEAKRHYGFLKPVERADSCKECRACEAKCPQKIPIADWMKKVQEQFA